MLLEVKDTWIKPLDWAAKGARMPWWPLSISVLKGHGKYVCNEIVSVCVRERWTAGWGTWWYTSGGRGNRGNSVSLYLCETCPHMSSEADWSGPLVNLHLPLRPGWPGLPEQPVMDDDWWSWVWAWIFLCECVCTCLYSLCTQTMVHQMHQFWNYSQTKLNLTRTNIIIIVCCHISFSVGYWKCKPSLVLVIWQIITA